MKWKSTNILFLLGIGLPVLCLAGLAWLTAWPHYVACGAVAAVCGTLLFWLFKKTACLPYPRDSYGSLTPLQLDLPGDFGVALCTDKSLAQHDFLLRIAEFVSPLRFGGATPMVVLNPLMLENEGAEFMAMAAVREIGRYKLKIQPKTVLWLLCPILALAALILSVPAFDLPLERYFGPFLTQLILPLVCALALVAHIFAWNRRAAAQDARLDRFMLQYYPADRVEWQIKKMGVLEGRFDKATYRPFNEHCLKERIEQLRSK